MRICAKCGAEFVPTTAKGYYCPPCRKAYDEAWRIRRRAEGKPASGARMPREYHRDYEHRYFQNPEKRARRNELMRGYSNTPELREHQIARRQVRRAIEAGRLVRQPCAICGATPADAHHDDYSQPLAVRWLCRVHHVEHHAKAEGSATRSAE